MRQWSLASRLAWVVLTLLALLWLGASLLSALTLREEVNELSDSALVSLATALMPAVAGIPASEMETPPTVEPGDDDGHVVYQVRDASGTVVARSAEAPESPFPAPLTPGFADSAAYRFFTLANRERTRFVQVAEARDERAEAVRESVTGLLWPLGVLLVLVALAIRIVIPGLTRPIQVADNEIAARGAGNLEPIPALGLPRELTPIVEAVNRLLERLRKLLEMERAFSSNSAHELRTPVAAALAQSQVLVGELTGPARERAQRLSSELARLAHTVEKLLQFSRAESGVGLSRGPVDLGRVAAAVAEPFLRHSRYTARMRLVVAAEPVIVEGDIDTLGIALENLIENAFGHGGTDVNVTVTVAEDGSVSVADNGRGVEPERLATLHEPFVRGARAGPGSGLGLSIASAIVEQAGGTLTLASSGIGRGFMATMRLNLSDRDPAEGR